MTSFANLISKIAWMKINGVTAEDAIKEFQHKLRMKNMSCNCKNPDGTFSQLCHGTCTQKTFIESDAVQMRSDKTIEDRFEYILSIFLEKLNSKINVLEMLVMDKYREGYDKYREGYQDGYRDAKESDF